MALVFAVLFSIITLVVSDLPTNYEYYTSNGIKSGLSVDQHFTLNDRNISIYSGAMHYFRVPRAYWRDRLKKIRAAGLNTVETYIPWNLHEHQSGVYDFGDGSSEMTDFLHLEEFLKTAQEEDLFTIIRSGPFICAEFEFGGLPSWLLREKNITVRTTDPVYMKYVTRYFNILMPILAKYQFTKGGPIIMLQVDNEYALNKYNDLEYLKELRQIILDHGIVELLVTSDNPSYGTYGTIPELFFMTANFDWDPENQLDTLKSNQPNKPLMVMEYWGGWFDFWGNNTHATKPSSEFRDIYERILKYPASVNLYMFEGGTSFGFLNGANNLNYDDYNTEFAPIVSSYDYDAPLTEGGDYTEKYYIVQELMSKYNLVQTKLPEAPALLPKIAYPEITIENQISFEKLLESTQPSWSSDVVSMETLDINGNSGQSYGYIVYRKENLYLEAGSVLTIHGRVCDTVIVLVNGKRVSPILETAADLDKFGTWRTKDSYLTLTNVELKNATLDLVVENWGRVNVVVHTQFKGIWQGDVMLGSEKLTDWTVYPLEFKKGWTDDLWDLWEDVKDVGTDTLEPKLYKARLIIEDEPSDTYVHMEYWTKGIVIVNGFVLGRYARMGPQQTLYLPAPILWKGENEIIIFEHFVSANKVLFSDAPIYSNH